MTRSYLRNLSNPCSEDRLGRRTLTNFLLYGFTVLAWGTSWIAMKTHLGVVPPEVSIAYRFMIAAGVMLIFCAIGRRSLRVSLADHGRLFVMGLFLFSFNFLSVYFGTAYLTSGLVSLIFSSVVIFNILFGSLIFRLKIQRRVIVGTLIGTSGIVLVFWPDLATFSWQQEGSRGFIWVLLGAALASLGMLSSGRMQSRGFGVFEANTIGMTYGAIIMVVYVMVADIPFSFDPQPRYWGALLFLGLVSTVAAFWTYLTLLGRIGAARAGYATVMFPVLAIAISVMVEDYQPDLRVLAGITLVLGGNVLILMKWPERSKALS